MMSTCDMLLDCGFFVSSEDRLLKRHFDMELAAYPAPEYIGTWRQGTWRCEVRAGDKVLESFESTDPAEMLDFFDRVILTVA